LLLNVYWLTRGWLHLPPGFAVVFVFVAGASGGAGVEAEAFAASGGFDGDQVPGVLGDYVGGDQIDLILGVNVAASPAAVGTDLIGAAVDGVGGLYLHTADVASPADDKVEAIAVSVGLGDGEAEAGRFAHEGQFGEFSLAFAGATWRAVAGRGVGVPVASLVFHGQSTERHQRYRLCRLFSYSVFVGFVLRKTKQARGLRPAPEKAYSSRIAG
jgi:hypothetical protein